MRYALHGFVVEASAPLTLLEVAEPEEERPPILSIQFHPACAAQPLDDARVLYGVHYDEEGTVPYWTVARHAERLRFHVHEQADFWLEGGQITVVPLPSIPGAVVEQLTVDLVVPRALHGLGIPCLHASAVRLSSGKAVAFMAETGTGKSTLCAMLTRRGGELLSDDAVAPQVVEGRVMVPPSYPSVRLWPDSATAVFGHDDFPNAARHHKRRVTSGSGVAAPLGGVYVLAKRDGGPPERERLSASEALKELAGSVHRLVDDDPRASAAEFALLGDLVAEVPVWRLHFAHDYRALPDVADLIEGS